MGVTMVHWEYWVRQCLCKTPENSDTLANRKYCEQQHYCQYSVKSLGGDTADKANAHPKAYVYSSKM